MTRSVTAKVSPVRTLRKEPASWAVKMLWVLFVLTLVAAGALLTLSVLETTEYDRDAYSIVR